LEYWNGSAWFQVHTATPNLANVGGPLTVAPNASDPTPGARGFFLGGLSPGEAATIDYINIASVGNAIDFGDLSGNRRLGAACASSTRGIAMGGYNGSTNVDIIEFITIASTGDATDFDDLTSARRTNSGLSNATRGLSFGGFTDPANIDTIEYITIASTGEAKDFGNLISALAQPAGCASPVRGVIAGGEAARVNTIQFVTITTLGDAQDFGDLSAAVSGAAAFGNAIRAIFGGGEISPTYQRNMESVTISSGGNAVKFGDLVQTGGLRLQGSASSSTRGIFAGGSNDTPSGSTVYNEIQSIEISTEGNAVDFGNLTAAKWQIMNGTTSNAHGGL
jgi:hypothetical protein